MPIRSPYLYQLEGIKQILSNKKYALWWDMGTGKSFTTLKAIQELGSSAIVVCPEAAKVTWEEENKYTNCILDFYNYTTFHKLKKDKVQGEIIVWDECHSLKDTGSQRSKKALELVGYGPSKVVLLSGTPVADKPIDLFHLLVLLGKRTLDEYYAFRNKYATMQKKAIWRYNKSKGRKEIWKIVQEIVGFKNLDLLREECQDVSSYLKLNQCHDLPPATFVPYYYNLTREEYKEYRILIGGHVQQLLQWSAKVSYSRVIKLVEKIREESGEKIVIFSNYIEVVKDLSKMLDNAPYLIGGLGADKIKEEVDKFYGGWDVLLATYKTGGFSLNLQCASYCLLVDLPYYLLEYRQALGRIYRVGQKSKTFYYLLLPKLTIIEEVFQLLEKKYNWTKQVFLEEQDFDILRFIEDIRNTKTP